MTLPRYLPAGRLGRSCCAGSGRPRLTDADREPAASAAPASAARAPVAPADRHDGSCAAACPPSKVQHNKQHNKHWIQNRFSMACPPCRTVTANLAAARSGPTSQLGFLRFSGASGTFLTTLVGRKKRKRRTKCEAGKTSKAREASKT